MRFQPIAAGAPLTRTPNEKVPIMRSWLSLAILIPVCAAAQTPSTLSRTDEIRLARSAAPPEITKDARIYVLDHDHFVVADPGHSVMSCMVTRTGPASIEPQCGDAEADATVLAVDRFRTEQRLAGRSGPEIEKAISDGLATGKFHGPKRPALVYMMSSMQALTDPSGKAIGKWMPHVMVFYPFMRDEDLGLVNTPDPHVPGTVNAGTALSALVVVTPGFVDPVTTQ
ncbi:MAG: hypothetical protein ACHQTF_10245 [Gemmatimonadales bacterium]